MKLAAVFILLLALTSTCSRECVRPTLTLSTEGSSWLTAYKNTPFVIYSNENQQLDTLVVDRQAYTDFCGAEEDPCGAYCAGERVRLTSASSKTLVIQVDVQAANSIFINKLPQTAYPRLQLITTNTTIFQTSAGVRAQFIDNYAYAGSTTRVVQSSCTDPVVCGSLRFTDYLISRDYGLLAFTDQRGQQWKRVQ